MGGVGRASDDGGGTVFPGRVRVYDVARGLAVISMVAFHACYDLRYLSGASLPWFSGAFQDVWRASISWTFVFVAGCMCRHSHDNLRRGARLLGLALAIFAVTYVAGVDTPISFGVIFCLGACGVVASALERMGALPKGPLAAVACALAFLALLDLPHGSVGIGPVAVEVPSALYDTPWLSWLGLPGPGFASGDYYPLLPYLMLYLAGAACAGTWREAGYPTWAKDCRCAPLELVGRHALLVYVVHQPLLLAVTGLLA